ncbi:hypothetical protein ACFQ0B_14080 [Nonomuraea thailandensis]
MRGHVRRLAVEIGAIGGLSALFSVAAGVFVNFSTDSGPELNPAHLPPAVLFSCLASAVPLVRARWAARSETTTDPYTAKDLAGYKRLLKKLRQEKGTPQFAELGRRAAELGLDVGRADLEKVTKQALRWLDDAGHAEPIIRAFLAVHQVRPPPPAPGWTPTASWSLPRHGAGGASGRPSWWRCRSGARPWRRWVTWPTPRAASGTRCTARTWPSSPATRPADIWP